MRFGIWVGCGALGLEISVIISLALSLAFDNLWFWILSYFLFSFVFVFLLFSSSLRFVGALCCNVGWISGSRSRDSAPFFLVIFTLASCFLLLCFSGFKFQLAHLF